MIQIDPTHVQVTQGDTLYAMSRALKVMPSQLLQANRWLPDPNVILVGDILHVPVAAVVTPPAEPDVFEAVNFTTHRAGFYSSTGFQGSGPTKTIYRVKPGSSTVDPGSNPTRIMRGGPVDGILRKGVVARGFKVEGYQEQITHGITLSYTDEALIEDLWICGIKGTGTTPPGETFSLELHQSMNPTIRNITIDARLTPLKNPVASSLLGFNSVDGGIVTGLHANYATGFGAALWQSGNYILEAPDFQYCRRALNMEQSYGTIQINLPDMRNRTSTTAPDVVVTCAGFTPVRGPQKDIRQTSAKVTIREPRWDRNRGKPLTIGIPTPGKPYSAAGIPSGSVHMQRAEDITVVIDGISYGGPVNNSLVRIGDYWG